MFAFDRIHEQLKECKLPSISQIKFLCQKVSEILTEEPNVVLLNPPISVVGDIHGQFFDLLELFEIGGQVPKTDYCFLGDYVDRGYYSLETFLLLLVLKVRYPSHITLLRGNHESRSCTLTYGFYKECQDKVGVEIYNHITSVFDLLPLSAVIGQDLFCVHGGLSPHITYIDEINKFNRKKEIKGKMSDLLWSDPDDTIEDWGVNNRGAGYLFGSNVVKQFNQINYLSCILRAHQMVDAGYYYMFDK